MKTGELVRQLRVKYGDRVRTNYGILTVDTNGDTIEVSYRNDEQRFMLQGTIVEMGAGFYVSLPFKTIEQVFAGLDAMIAVDGSFESVEALNLIIGAVDELDSEELEVVAGGFTAGNYVDKTSLRKTFINPTTGKNMRLYAKLS